MFTILDRKPSRNICSGIDAKGLVEGPFCVGLLAKCIQVDIEKTNDPLYDPSNSHQSKANLHD